MKVRILRNIARRTDLTEGKECDVERPLAESLISQGLAVSLEKPKQIKAVPDKPKPLEAKEPAIKADSKSSGPTPGSEPFGNPKGKEQVGKETAAKTLPAKPSTKK